MTTTPQQHLQTVINHWADLETALGTPNTLSWPPSGLGAYLNALEQLDADEVAELREQRAHQRAGTESIGERPVPIRVRVHDTMRGVERALLELADQTASTVQRPAGRALPAAPGDSIGLRLRTAALADQADRTRWSWTARETRTAPLAAVWLTHRLDDAPGPFRPLTILQREHITTVAKGAADRVYAALDMTRLTRVVQHDCPHCRGTLQVEGGDGTPPKVRCTELSCGWTRTADTAAA